MPASIRQTTAKRTEIADAALRIIGERGITALTMASLAEELGVSPGAPFRHFSSRNEILEEVAHRVVELMRKDKKSKGGEFRFTLIDRIGSAVTDVPVTAKMAREALEHYRLLVRDRR